MMFENRSLIVTGNNLFSPSSVFSINIVGFVKISSYCGFPQCGHSFDFFAFSNICSGIRYCDIRANDALYFLNFENSSSTSWGTFNLEQDLHVAFNNL